ncbi:MAG: glycosyltransferase family 39 protein [Parcubacteria group bacterium]|nr:glycosyltransferase family 39 protein [Parcubacteria group bacterium]
MKSYQKYLLYGGLIFSAAVAIFFSFYYNFLADDAFITMRYARNFNNGDGLVYIIGERVNGATSFLWLILLSFFGMFGVDYVFAARSLSLLFSIATVILVFFLCRKIIDRRFYFLCVIAAFLVGINNIVAVWSLSGMYDTMYMFSVVLSLFLTIIFSHRPSSSRALFLGGIFSLMILSRLEGIVVMAILFLWLIFQRKQKITINQLFFFLSTLFIIVGGYFIFHYFYYDAWLPNTFYAKVGFSFAQIIRGIRYALYFLIDYGQIAFFITPLVIVLLFRPRYGILIAGVIAGILGEIIFVGGDGLGMYRFMLPVIPLWVILLVMSVELLFSYIPLLYAKIIISISIMMITVFFIKYPSFGYEYGRIRDMKQYEIPRWTAVGKWLRQNAKPNESVALVPIGAVGYYSNLKIYDMLGLTDQYIAHKKIPLGNGFPGHEKFDGPYTLSRRPTYLLLGNIQVLDEPLPLDHQFFGKPFNAEIRARENEFFIDDFYRLYEPQIARLPEGWYFHFFKLKSELQ